MALELTLLFLRGFSSFPLRNHPPHFPLIFGEKRPHSSQDMRHMNFLGFLDEAAAEEPRVSPVVLINGAD